VPEGSDELEPERPPDDEGIPGDGALGPDDPPELPEEPPDDPPDDEGGEEVGGAGIDDD
jgi:hypothetical protein